MSLEIGVWGTDDGQLYVWREEEVGEWWYRGWMLERWMDRWMVTKRMKREKEIMMEMRMDAGKKDG